VYLGTISGKVIDIFKKFKNKLIVHVKHYDASIDTTRLRFERRWYSARTLDKEYYTPTINNYLSR